ncbi:MAG: DUF2730 family protein [Pedobacter sp.]
MDYEALRFWRDAVLAVLMAANFIYTWWVNREKVNARRFKSLEDKVADKQDREEAKKATAEYEDRCLRHRERTGSIEGALGRLQTEVHHLPSQADIGRVHARMDDVLGLVKELGGNMQASRRQLDLVLEELLRRDK